MTTIKKENYTFSVDTEMTREYYETHSLCDCENCRNYYTQIKDRFPKLGMFLSEFGVDISKPDEIFSFEMEECVDYINVDYTVCGRIEEMGECDIDIYEDLPVKVAVTDGFNSPNEQTGDYFTLSVNKIMLPKVLNEAFAEDESGKTFIRARELLKKLFGK